MNAQTRLSAKGQVVIPKDVRDRLGLLEGTIFDVEERDGEIILRQGGNGRGRLAVADAVREIQSFYRYEGPPVSLAEMTEAAQRAAVENYLRRMNG